MKVGTSFSGKFPPTLRVKLELLSVKLEILLLHDAEYIMPCKLCLFLYFRNVYCI